MIRLRLSPAQQRVFVLHKLDQRLGVDATRPMRVELEDCITIRLVLVGSWRYFRDRRSTDAIFRKLDAAVSRETETE